MWMSLAALVSLIPALSPCDLNMAPDGTKYADRWTVMSLSLNPPPGTTCTSAVACFWPFEGFTSPVGTVGNEDQEYPPTLFPPPSPSHQAQLEWRFGAVRNVHENATGISTGKVAFRSARNARKCRSWGPLVCRMWSFFGRTEA